MNQSEHYNLNLVEGSDLVNPLVQDVPNYEAIDEQMYKNEQASVGKATELTSGTVHTLTRTGTQPIFRFTATSNFNSGETFVVDGVQVTALTPSGETLPSGAYIIGSEVLCALRDTLLTVFVAGSVVADNALKLGGEEPSYYGKAEDVATAQSTATAAGVLAQANAQQISNLSGQISLDKTYSTNEQLIGTWIDGKPLYRKVIEADIDTSGHVPFANLEADYFAVISGRSLRNNIYSNPLSYVESVNSLWVYHNKSTNQINAVVGTAAYPTRLTVVVEYTKP